MIFERDQTQFQVEKPVPKMDWYIAFGGSGSFSGESVVSIGPLCPNRARPTRSRKTISFEYFWSRIEAIRNELLAWIRAVTRQYWVGYRESDFLSEQMKFMILGDEHETFLERGVGKGFQVREAAYGR